MIRSPMKRIGPIRTRGVWLQGLLAYFSCFTKTILVLIFWPWTRPNLNPTSHRYRVLLSSFSASRIHFCLWRTCSRRSSWAGSSTRCRRPSTESRKRKTRKLPVRDSEDTGTQPLQQNSVILLSNSFFLTSLDSILNKYFQPLPWNWSVQGPVLHGSFMDFFFIGEEEKF